MTTYHEIVGNLHNHTPYSDGNASHAEIAAAAQRAGLDFVVVTDHNIWVDGVQGYYAPENGGRGMLLLTGEEIHDQNRHPQKNHLLVYGTHTELAACAPDPQELIDTVNAHNGLCFIAHPYDIELPMFHEPAISWEDWQVSGYTGLEIWNYMSNFKTIITGWISVLRYAFNPELGITGPDPRALRKWDELLASGQRVAGIGNADAHANMYTAGPITRCIFPYEMLYRAVNTHLLLEKPLTGDWVADEQAIYAALGRGRAYIAYHMPHDPRGFRFTANTSYGTATMGDEIKGTGGGTLQANVPARADLRIIHNGRVVREAKNSNAITHLTGEPGAYRVEAWIEYKGRSRAWILSNPIYIK